LTKLADKVIDVLVPSSLRPQFPDACHPLMAWGNRREAIFVDDEVSQQVRQAKDTSQLAARPQKFPNPVKN